MKTNTTSTLALRLPSRHAAKAMADWREQPMAFALRARNGTISRSGVATLAELAPQCAQVQRVLLLLAASDVTLLRMQVPPLSAARLKAALPALVEDRLITDTADCILVAVPEAGNMRTIAVLERSWLQTVVTSVRSLGARQIVALPLQLALPLPAHGAAATVTEMHKQIDLAVRLSANEGMGLPMAPVSGDEPEVEVCLALMGLAAHQPIALSVPAARLDAYRHAAQSLAPEGMQFNVDEEDWLPLLQGADSSALDLMTGLATTESKAIDWRRWRWPLVLAGLLILVNVLALNWDWWRLRSEANDVRAAMLRTYKNAFPADSVVVDPLAQAQQKIAAAQRRSGQAAPDDFVALAASMGEVWSALPAGVVDQTKSDTVTTATTATTAIAALGYRDGTLSVRFKPGMHPPLAAARSALAPRQASVTEGPAEGEGLVWLIRSAP